MASRSRAFRRAADHRDGGRRIPAAPPPRPQVGMPRRFGIATLMILTAAFAVLFSMMKMLDTDPAVFVCISIFVAGIAACQVLMFKGKNPRKASFVGGYIVGGVIAVGMAVVGQHLLAKRRHCL